MGIKAWWELHKENHKHVKYNRTNSGSLENVYDEKNYVYRIEKRTIEGVLLNRMYQQKKSRRSVIAAWKIQSQQRIIHF